MWHTLLHLLGCKEFANYCKNFYNNRICYIFVNLIPDNHTINDTILPANYGPYNPNMLYILPGKKDI